MPLPLQAIAKAGLAAARLRLELRNLLVLRLIGNKEEMWYVILCCPRL